MSWTVKTVEHPDHSDCGGLCDLINAKDTEPRKLSTSGKILIGVAGAVFVGVNLVALPFVSPGLRKICLPFLPATPVQIQNVLIALRGRTGTLLDIGSGDGRIVIETAKHGFKATGVELNIWLVLYSRLNARRHKVHSTTNFVRKDLWKTDLSGYNNIVIFGVKSMMEKLETKFNEEVNDNARIVACRFPLPNWKPVQTIGSGVDTVWLYKVEKNEL